MRWLFESGSAATVLMTLFEAAPPIGVRLSSQSAAGIIAMIAMNQSSELNPLEAVIESAPAQPAHALARRDDVGQPDAELVVDHHDLALRDQVAVDEHVHRLTRERLEFDDGALRQLQDVLDRNARAAEFHRQLDGDVQD